MDIKSLHSDKTIKWLLTVILFFNISLFSGYANNQQVQLKAHTQSELVIKKTPKASSRTISYKIAFRQVFSNNDFTVCRRYWGDAARIYNQLSFVKFKNSYNLFLLYNFESCIEHIKIIPQSSEKEALIG